MKIQLLVKSTIYLLLLVFKCHFSYAIDINQQYEKATTNNIQYKQNVKRLPATSTSITRPPPIGNKLVYALKVPVDIRNLHQDVKSFGILCTISPGPYIPYNPNIDYMMDWVWAFDFSNGGTLSGEGYTSINVTPSIPNHKRIVSVLIEVDNDKPKPIFYRCVLRLTDSSHNGHHNTIPWNYKDVAKFPPRSAAPGTVYIPVIEGRLP